MTPVPRQGLPRWGKWLISIFFIGAVGTLIWSQLPRGAYSTDLTRVGAGRPALVLAYDINTMGGMAVMELMDSLRGEYTPRVELLVAALGEPGGFGFAQRYGAVNGTVMTFAGDGSHLRTIHLPASATVLRRALDEVVAGPTR